MKSKGSTISLTLLSLTLLAMLFLGKAEAVEAGPSKQLSPTNPNDKAALVALYNSTNQTLPWNITTDPCLDAWEGVQCFDYGFDFAVIEVLDLGGRHLNGSIPPELGNMAVGSLLLNNNHLSGSIPSELGNMEVVWLDLSSNQLNGSIPPALGNIGKLSTLDLRNNQLSGDIPSELGNLNPQKIDDILLGNNQLNGNVPPELGNLDLTWLDLEGNPLTGELPINFSSMSNLSDFGFNKTCLTEPDDPAFQAWLNSIPNLTRNTTPHPDCDPLQVKACIEGKYFIQDVLLVNRYDAYLEEPPLGSTVEFDLAGQKSSDTVSSELPARAFYNMGNDLNFGDNEFTVTGMLPDSSEVGPVKRTLTGLKDPSWLPGTPTVKPVGDCVAPETRAITYNWQLRYPDEPFKMIVVPPSWIPYLGGDELGIKETQATLEAGFKPIGNGDITANGQTGLTGGGHLIAGKISGIGILGVNDEPAIMLEDAELKLNIDTALKLKINVVDLICKAFTAGTCPLSQTKNIPIIGAVSALVEAFEVDAKFEPSFSGEARIKREADELAWQDSAIGSELKITISKGIPLPGGATFTPKGGGNVGGTYQFPPAEVKDFKIGIFAGYELTLFTYGKCIYEVGYDWVYPNDGQQGSHTQQGCGLVNPLLTKVASQAPSRNDSPARFAQTSSLSATILATNLIGESTPAIAVRDSTLLLWSDYDVNKAFLQGDEIYYSHYNGTTWLTPTAVTDDGLQDFGPQIAFDPSNQGVAIWQRNKTQQSEATTELNAAYTKAFEIASAVWDGSSWSTPIFLTDNSAYDSVPSLIRGNDGQLVAVWRQNEAGELLGNSVEPDKLLVAVWDGAAWRTPQIALNDVAGILGYTIARHDILIGNQKGANPVARDRTRMKSLRLI